MATPGAQLATQMPKESLGDFDNIPWVQAIINDPACSEIPFQSRTITRNSTLHSLFNRTLATLDTYISTRSSRLPVDLILPNAMFPDSGLIQDTDNGKKKESLLIASMGHGLDGHPGLAHGGTIATLFDEGLALGALQVLPRQFVTAESKIKFKKAVPTPGVIMLRCWCEKWEGRKAWIKGTLEDGEGGVYAEAESLFIMTKSKL